MQSSLLLAALVGVATASSVIHIHHPSNFNQTARCAPCRPSHVCILSSTHTQCIDRALAMKRMGGVKFVEYGSETERIGGKHKIVSAAEHRRREHLGKRECSVADLHSVGGRLLLWAREEHTKRAGVERSLPAHSIACLPSTAWMFSQFDGDSDGFLNPTELISLIGNEKREPCLHQFVDHCDDVSVDGLISVDEWCDCLSFALDQRHEPVCHREKHNVDPHIKDAFIPHCDTEGFYSPAQCFKGECWCVDKYGREMDGSRVSKKLPECRQYAVALSEMEMADLTARL